MLTRALLCCLIGFAIGVPVFAVGGPAAATPRDSSGDSLTRGVVGVYATVWSDSGVIGCRGRRGALSSDVLSVARSVLTDAVDEASLTSDRPLVRARVCFLHDGRAIADGCTFDPAACALVVDCGQASAVILPGEARTSSYAWRKARTLLTRRGAPARSERRAQVYEARIQDLDADTIARWLHAENAAR